MPEEILNRVARSGLEVLSLADFLPPAVVAIDLSEGLREGLFLQEKPFRQWLSEQDWARYQAQVVALYCSTEAIIPPWGAMLITTALAPHTKEVFFGTQDHVRTQYALRRIAQTNWTTYTNKKVMLKGCAQVPEAVYVQATQQLLPHVQSLMFGEPCGAVPLFKKKS